MNRDDSFDQVLEGWLRREAPPQAPDRVLDAALQRVSAASQRRGWAQRLLGGKPMASVARLALVAAAVAVAAFVGLRLGTTDDVGPSPSPAPSATPTPGPTAALPSTEPSAVAFLVRLWDGGESGWVHLVTVLDDGRLITSDPFDRAPMERRLTEAGIQLIRDEMDATGLTDTSAMYMPVANPGVDPPRLRGCGAATRDRPARWRHRRHQLVSLRGHRGGLVPAAARGGGPPGPPGPSVDPRGVASRGGLGRCERRALPA
jgi:hypothetical protein